MLLLADENVHPLVVEELRRAGHLVEWVGDTAPGSSDVAILQRADIGRMVLVTYDRDFGELIFHRGWQAPKAVLYTRLNRADPAQIARRLIAVLERGVQDGQMMTITQDGERIRPFAMGAEHG